VSRIKLSEFAAKSLLVDDYAGASLRIDSLESDVDKLADDESYIVKVDQGIKKRGKQGLIVLNVSKENISEAVRSLADKGFSRFVAEPMFPHEESEERYVSFERTRGGISVHYSERGGVNVEDNPESVKA